MTDLHYLLRSNSAACWSLMMARHQGLDSEHVIKCHGPKKGNLAFSQAGAMGKTQTSV
jgi:hypothetical protein